MNAYHIPALLHETIDGLHIRQDGVYVDVTFGGGGHSREILNHLGKNGKLLGFDQDEEAYNNRPDDERFIFVRSNFRHITNFLKYHGVEQVDGILADLGVSSHHFDSADRGFSFRFDGNLDMRMNKKATLSAEQIINTYSEEKLADLFYNYGELNNARKLASAIAKARAQNKITTINQLLEILQPFFKFEREKKDLAKAFQAIRIEVNDEMSTLKELLMQVPGLLKPGGRLAVITYHSLEDRMVKNFIRSGNMEGKLQKDFYGNIQAPLKAINNKPIVPTDDEVQTNPRARSAKLRVAEKVNK
ncbi:MAG: S-adenosyl-methyltransferase MraW [Bacteroidetes bacterium]|nr:S-adenosyl-methyltransferase MraW [Bacteroidota bacterium]